MANRMQLLGRNPKHAILKLHNICQYLLELKFRETETMSFWIHLYLTFISWSSCKLSILLLMFAVCLALFLFFNDESSK